MPTYDEVAKFLEEYGKTQIKDKKVKKGDEEKIVKVSETTVGKADYRKFMKDHGILPEMVQKLEAFECEFGAGALQYAANDLVNKKDEFSDPDTASSVVKVSSDNKSYTYKVHAHTKTTVPGTSDTRDNYGVASVTLKIKASFISDDLCDDISEKVKTAFA